MGACQGLAQQVQGLEEGAACRAPDVQAQVKEAGPSLWTGQRPASASLHSGAGALQFSAGMPSTVSLR